MQLRGSIYVIALGRELSGLSTKRLALLDAIAVGGSGAQQYNLQDLHGYPQACTLVFTGIA